jgi:hypothetical protein
VELSTPEQPGLERERRVGERDAGEVDVLGRCESRVKQCATGHARIEPELRSQLVAVARANDRSVAAEIRTAIRKHLEREQLTAANPGSVTPRPSRSPGAHEAGTAA